MKNITGLKVLSLAVAGIGLLLSAKLQDQQIDEAVSNALYDRGVLPMPPVK